MQNMNSNSSITTTTEATNSSSHAGEPERPTLAQLLAERDEERQQQDIARAQQQQQERERERREALDYGNTWIGNSVSPELATALGMSATCAEDKLDQYDDEYGVIATRIELNFYNPEIDAEAHPFVAQPERWYIQFAHVRYSGYRWHLYGPHGYDVSLPEPNHYNAERIDRYILDALAAYPAWLAAADERADAEQERIAAKVAAEERQKPPTFHNLLDVLQRGTRVKICATNPAAEDGMMTYTGTIVDTSDTWLMLESESGRQRAIPMAQIVNLTPVGAE